MSIPTVTILRMSTPDDTSDMRCLSCGMEWGGEERNSSSIWRHIHHHHLRINEQDVPWGDRHIHFPAKFPHDPTPCQSCGADTVGSESGRALECLCAWNTERREAARQRCTACGTEADMAERHLALSSGDPYRIPAGLHTCGMATS